MASKICVISSSIETVFTLVSRKTHAAELAGFRDVHLCNHSALGGLQATGAMGAEDAVLGGLRME